MPPWPWSKPKPVAAPVMKQVAKHFPAPPVPRDLTLVRGVRLPESERSKVAKELDYRDPNIPTLEAAAWGTALRLIGPVTPDQTEKVRAYRQALGIHGWLAFAAGLAPEDGRKYPITMQIDEAILRRYDRDELNRLRQEFIAAYGAF